MKGKAAVKRGLVYRTIKRLGYRAPDSSMRARLWRLTYRRFLWWDWGHRAMILIGTPLGEGQ